MTPDTLVAFLGHRCLATGAPADVLAQLKQQHDADPTAMPLVFERLSGRQVDFDLRGRLDEVLARAAAPQTPAAPRGRGRPKLGVASREVTLLPRHWEWLEAQPSGASAALRRLVEAALRSEPGEAEARRAREAASRLLGALAGDLPGFEEAMRALYADQTDAFEQQVAHWPADVRSLAVEMAREAAWAASTATRPVAAAGV
jgi:hypothetical protein